MRLSFLKYYSIRAQQLYPTDCVSISYVFNKFIRSTVGHGAVHSNSVYFSFNNNFVLFFKIWKNQQQKLRLIRIKSISKTKANLKPPVVLARSWSLIVFLCTQQQLYWLPIWSVGYDWRHRIYCIGGAQWWINSALVSGPHSGPPPVKPKTNPPAKQPMNFGHSNWHCAITRATQRQQVSVAASMSSQNHAVDIELQPMKRIYFRLAVRCNFVEALPRKLV